MLCISSHIFALVVDWPLKGTQRLFNSITAILFRIYKCIMNLRPENDVVLPVCWYFRQPECTWPRDVNSLVDDVRGSDCLLLPAHVRLLLDCTVVLLLYNYFAIASADVLLYNNNCIL